MARMYKYLLLSALVAIEGCSSSSASDVANDDGGGVEAFDAGDAGDASAPIDSGTISDDAATTFDASSKAWSPVSFGITTKDVGSGNQIAIVYGGYTATDAESQAWITALTTSKLSALGVGHLYAVRGPKDADYAAREIGNSTLATALAAQSSASAIVVIAHSSGGFVADELFTFASTAVLAKVAYFNLDGGSYAMNSAMVAKMKGVYICDAHDPVAGNSENTSSDLSLHSNLTGSHLFTVDATGSGCNVGAGWCLHDTLIINHPHNPANYDLALDYTDFTAGRDVVTSYVAQAVKDGVL
ncbi:MAG: hypothetical protein ABI461_14455 [Polyangiaceae bacterium]